MEDERLTAAGRPLTVCVLGLWHLGAVTSACLAQAGHRVVGVDDDVVRVAALRRGRAPVAEPGLDELLQAGLAAGRLRFETDPSLGTRDADVTWVTYDTPVDDDDVADVEYVLERVRAALPGLMPGSVLLLSSQLPVGTCDQFRAALKGRDVSVAYSPENLRLGHAIEAFTQAQRILVGIGDDVSRAPVEALLAPFSARLEWMSIRSAEMSKHAINAYLATSVAFANELARLCETNGADPGEVERGLRSEPRIGQKAYIRPGAAFAGGTLARDVVFLQEIGQEHGRPTPLLDGVRASNQAHQLWPDEVLRRLIGRASGRQIAIWGLTYTVGTSTLRRSASIELCHRLARGGAGVCAFDPAVAELPPADRAAIHLADSALEAVRNADALVVMTPWPELGRISAPQLVERMRRAVVVDPDASFSQTLDVPEVQYASVGRVPA